MMRIGLIAFGLVLVWGHPAVGASKSVSWSDQACQLNLKFDPAKQAETAIMNTIHLLFGLEESLGPLGPITFEPEDYKNFDFDKLTEECRRSIERVKDLPLVRLPGIEDYRHALTEAIKDCLRIHGNQSARFHERGGSAPISARRCMRAFDRSARGQE
jgi:hypothetical protein